MRCRLASPAATRAHTASPALSAWLMASVGLAAAACAEVTAPIPAVEGTWTSRSAGQPMVLVLRAATPHAGQTLVGDAHLRRRDGVIVTSAVGGTTALPRVVLTLLVDGQRVQLDGSVARDTLTATWIGGALAGRNATLVRTSTRTSAGRPEVPNWSDDRLAALRRDAAQMRRLHARSPSRPSCGPV